MRRLLSHINGLPADSATARKQRGVSANWDQQAELQASTVDELRKLTFYFLKANGGNPSEPEFFPRPGEHTEPETVGLAQFAQFLKE
ncbi:hypothetical protein [Leifsonia sp. NPDC058248]|uniref:hypothetical protein n=1 Tax=Leifsonia sp. NPDC058248 TaxID=3346402 RepID=UPI0036DAA7E7